MTLEEKSKVTIELESGEKVQGLVKHKSYWNGRLWKIGIKTDLGFITISTPATTEKSRAIN